MTDVEVDPGNSSQNKFATWSFAGYCAFLLIAFAALNLLAAFALPQDKYLRYLSINDPQAPTAPWIYQRIHDDQTPIDVAFIGTSRTGLSVHTRRLEADLAQHGIMVKAANLYMVNSGINMQYALAKELLTNRKVKLLVLEMTEREERLPHQDFIYLADPIDVIDAPWFINVNYLSDLARLPGRQLELFWQTEAPRIGLPASQPVRRPYQGSNLDNAEFLHTLDGIDHDRNRSYSLAEMERLRIAQDRLITPPVLPKFLSGLEFRFPRYYEDRIIDLARAHGTAVVFLYTPRYGGPENPPPYGRYANRLDLINPWSKLQDYGIWWDDSHLNWEGAKRLTDAVADTLAARYGQLLSPAARHR